MKRYKVNKGLFLILPVLDISVMLLYGIFLFRNSYTWVNVVNLIIDGIILIYYMINFCYEVSMDSQGINFYTIFGKRRVINSEINKIRYASFLTGVISGERRFYIITTRNGGIVLRKILESIKDSKS